MTKGLLIPRQRKLVLSSHLEKHPSADNRRKFKVFRTMYNKLIRAAKKVYFEESLEKNKNNLKKMLGCLKGSHNKKE